MERIVGLAATALRAPFAFILLTGEDRRCFSAGPQRPDWTHHDTGALWRSGIVERIAGGTVQMRDVMAELSPEQRKAAATLRTQIAPDLPPLVISAHAMEQILINLLANALDAVAGIAHPVVQVRARVLAENPRFAIVEVADNGSGVAKAVRHRLFESFFTTKGEEQGTGLGLAVSREIARTSGGDLELLDEPGTWSEPAATVFRLTLPVSQEL